MKLTEPQKQLKKKIKEQKDNAFVSFVNKHGFGCVAEYIFHPTRKWAFDYAIIYKGFKVAIEVEGGIYTGGRHTSIKGFLGDMEKYNTATCMGWKLIRVTPDTLMLDNTIEIIKMCCK